MNAVGGQAGVSRRPWGVKGKRPPELPLSQSLPSVVGAQNPPRGTRTGATSFQLWFWSGHTPRRPIPLGSCASKNGSRVPCEARKLSSLKISRVSPAATPPPLPPRRARVKGALCSSIINLPCLEAAAVTRDDTRFQEMAPTLLTRRSQRIGSETERRGMSVQEHWDGTKEIKGTLGSVGSVGSAGSVGSVD